MTKNYSEMSNAELVELKQKIEKELAERKQTSKPEKPPFEKPRVEKPRLDIPPLERMLAMFCRKCGHPIWEYITRSYEFSLSDPKSEFYVEGRGGKPKQITHCPNCKRKLSPGRLRFSDEIEEVIHEGTERSENLPKVDGTICYKYCVECSHKIGLLRNSDPSDPPQFFDEADRQKPISACPICNTPLKEADDVDFNDKQRATLNAVYEMILQWAEEKPVLENELAQLFEKIKAKKPESLEGVKAIVGVHTAWYCKDKTSLKEQLAKCRDYCKTNGLEVIEELNYSYHGSDKNLKLDKLLERKIGAVVASMNWLTSYSLREAVEFVRELERAGIHLEIIVGEEGNED